MPLTIPQALALATDDAASVAVRELAAQFAEAMQTNDAARESINVANKMHRAAMLEAQQSSARCQALLAAIERVKRAEEAVRPTTRVERQDDSTER